MRPTDELITELPLELPGQVYRSVMPNSVNYDPGGNLPVIYKEKGIRRVVVLETAEKFRTKTGEDLAEFYAERGLAMQPFPIEDYGVPEIESLREIVEDILARARQGEHIAIHCHAGIGRTGMVAACLAKRALGLNGEEALAWIDQRVPGAPETQCQKDIVRDF